MKGVDIELLSHTDDGPVREMIDGVGEGPFEIRIAVGDLDTTRDILGLAGIDARVDARTDGLLVSGDVSLEARLVFVSV